MPMWSAGTDHKGRSVEGFTLVELLVVLFIIGMAAALVAPQFDGLSASTERHKDLTQLASSFNRARLRAIRSGEVATFSLAEKSEVVTVSGNRESLTFSEPARLRCGAKFRQVSAQLSFFPNGSSSGLSCKITFVEKKLKYIIRISPVTGLVALSA